VKWIKTLFTKRTIIVALYKIFLSTQEEVGRIGMQHALVHNKPFFENITFNLCADRHSSDGNDIVYHYRDLVMCPEIMLNRIEAISDEIGYSMRRFASPHYADCYNTALAGIPSVNLSCGIYYEHPQSDRVNINQAVQTLEVIVRCVELNDVLLSSGDNYMDNSANVTVESER
jgi:putative aminopeptidase FrvX